MPTPLGHILGLGHLAVGALAIVAPFTAARMFRIVPAASTAFVTRAFGTRDLILGLGIQLYERPSPEHQLAVSACGLIHAIDVVNAVVTYAQGNLPFEALVAAGSVDAVLVALSWWELSA